MGLEVVLLWKGAHLGWGRNAKASTWYSPVLGERERRGSDTVWNPVWATQHITAILPIKHSTSVLVLPARAVADSMHVCGFQVSSCQAYIWRCHESHLQRGEVCHGDKENAGTGLEM